jgi:hypothetical protein
MEVVGGKLIQIINFSFTLLSESFCMVFIEDI